LDAASARERFKRSTGAPMCGRFGYVLGKASMEPAEVATVGAHYASDCEAFGLELPATPVSIEPRVSTPDVDVLKAGTTREVVKTCTACENRVPSGTVDAEWGFPLDLCRAKGSLIIKPRGECVGCPYAKPLPEDDGVYRRPKNLAGLELLPEFQPGFKLADHVVAASLSEFAAGDPRTYVSDVPVSKADADRGIKAWRKLVDPDGSGKFTFLPIYNPEFLTPEEREIIPQAGDAEHPELYVDYDNRLYRFAVQSRLDETFILVGPPGVGKTEFARYVAWLCQLPFQRFSFTNQSDPDDMIGTKDLADGRTFFTEGRIPTAWRRPCVMVLDEPNVAPESIWQTLRPLTDNSKQLVIDAAAGIRVPRNDFCFFMMGVNPEWDMRNVGTREVADADKRRLRPMAVKLPPEHIERHIVKSTVKALDGVDVSDDDLDFIAKVAIDIREASEQGRYPGTWGIALQVAVARQLQWFTPIVAYKSAALDWYDPKTVEVIFDAIKGHLKPASRGKRTSEPPF
jgi:hypothetical protein